MCKLYLTLFFFTLLVLAVPGCTKERESRVVDIKSFPLDSTRGVITSSGVELDKEISSDGKGSLKIVVEEAGKGPSVVRLFELGDLDIENARLIYSARLRTGTALRGGRARG